MSKDRKHINDIEIRDIIGRWDAEPNDLIERIFVRETGNLEIIQKTSNFLCEINLNQKTEGDLPVLEISNTRGENNHFNEEFWTIWRYTGNEMDIDFSNGLRIRFNYIN